MEHQGILLFLSDVKVRDGKVRVTNYKDIGDCYTTNESAVRYCVQKHEPLERLFAFATQKVQSTLKDENTKEAYCDEDGNPYTHLSYFEYRLRQGEHPIEAELEVASYNEEGEMNENIQSIVDMAAKVDAFIAKLPKDDTLVLHADSTGGMRNAAMVTMAILRLMQYDDRVRIGDILYSNWNKHIVEKVNDIYALFDLISGAEEFVRFGSVQTLRDYYKRQAMSKQSPELQQLIKAMADFSDAISLCNYGIFRDAITNLRRTMENFHDRMHDANGEASLPDSLMNRLYGRIRHEYRWLLRSEEPDDITLIEWCIQHDYIQQALTLYTERVPKIFCSYNIVTLTKEGQEAFDTFLQNSTDKAPAAVQLYTQFCNKDREREVNRHFSNIQNDYDQQLKAASQLIRTNARTDQKTDWAIQAQGVIKDYLKENSHTDIVDTVSLNDELGLAAGFSLIQALCRTPGKIMQGEISLGDLEMKKLQVLKAAYMSGANNKRLQDMKSYEQGNNLVKFVEKMSSDDLQKLFSGITISVPYPNRFLRLLDCGWAYTDLSKEVLYKLLDQYGTIKDARNHTNHARNDHQLSTLEDIKALLTEYVENIKEVCYRQRAETSKTETESHEENGTA
ncbi:TM1812 family CRISPR-associated protein [Megasphaera sp. DISK 18]|uniref:TM1812 family CRISPR-associated protein n=1 Tax=Megasphaera sp. DISK 18 TaxID=1776081 RepID=UPI000806F78E|nr:TM1812 family CRISPR-associated protein [Megasphaera sp. DISK 18]OBZ32253.1 hypothetical protein A0U42_01890 [Megasphaera sp. DISK 18]